MRILAIDIGTGTQDILVFDAASPITNCPKMVMPSPTATLAARILAATQRKDHILFTGFTMGGGPSTWAVKQHIKAGFKVFATPAAARTFDDDPAEVQRMGIVAVSEDEAKSLQGAVTMELKDVDLASIGRALAIFGVSQRFDLVAVAVLDHGAAPPGVSDRAFRFEHMLRRLRDCNDLLAFTYLCGEIPDYLTRMTSVEKSLVPEYRTLLMDTGFAAVTGADEDPLVSRHKHRIIINLGNSHTIAFHLNGLAVLGMFEHHTRALDRKALETAVSGLADGSLTNTDVFESGGHGAVVLKVSSRRHFVAAVGPQRGRLSGSSLYPYFAVPHGDMMIAGCFGLVRACALRIADWREEIQAALSREES
ncbi:MAG: DUF1786 domain-containing protein [Chloroflexi bacterium]|nr:DUF1786 domain-containing protein [Chloroflexota bacterium]